jgi:CubicO group peptidase (beta-lactamase class C family)
MAANRAACDAPALGDAKEGDMRVWLRGLGGVAMAGLAIGAARGAELPPPQVAGVPIPEGQVAAAVGKLDGLVAAVMERTGVPGIAVAVVSGGTVAYARGFGVREVGRPEPVDADTVFQLASVSKSVGATVVAHEVGEGHVRWDTKVAGLLPWFALGDPAVTAMLTVGDLYSHRSGLPDHAGDDLEDLGYDRRQVLERLRLLPLHRFRDNYDYTNFGLTAGAEAVAAAAGTDWETLSETVLYRPLGMGRTSSRFADYIARDNRAVPHVRIAETWEAKYQRKPDAQSPAGGVSSSVNDMARWMLMVLGNGSFEGQPIVAPEALLPALSPQAVSSPPFAPDARASFYGFGIGVSDTPAGRVMFSHSGAFALGAATSFAMIPSADVGIVVLSNAEPVGAVEAIGLSFMDLVQFGDVTRDWYATIEPLMARLLAPFGKLVGQAPPADAAPAGELAAYAGTYGNDYYGPAEVAVEGDGLVLRLGPAGMAFPLRHWSGDSFVLQPAGENASDGSVSEVSFRMGAAGAEAVTIEFWNQEGLGTFTR